MAQAHRERHKVPFWAMPVLAALPLWAYVYTGTLSPPPAGEGPEVLGEELYASSGCAGCHGAGGAGSGSFPPFTEGRIYETWPSFVEHFEWVRLGSAGWLTERGETYGANDKPVIGGMPGFSEDQLSDANLLYVVLHERLLGGDNPDTEDAEAIEAVALLMSENPDMTFEEALAEVGVELPVTEGGGSGAGRGDPPPKNAPNQDGTSGSDGNDGPGTSAEPVRPMTRTGPAPVATTPIRRSRPGATVLRRSDRPRLRMVRAVTAGRSKGRFEEPAHSGPEEATSPGAAPPAARYCRTPWLG